MQYAPASRMQLLEQCLITEVDAMRCTFVCKLVATIVVALGGVNSMVSAQEFRVETKVYANDDKAPVAETLSIFSDGIVYDFLLSGAKEMTMFDRMHNRIVLLDPERQVKTELSTDAILAFIAKMKARLGDAQRRYLSGSGMKLENEEGGWIKLYNDRVIYRAKGVTPKESDAVLQYRQFADWYARLNAMRLGNLPPFARLRLNAELAERGFIPKEVERTIIFKTGLSESKETLRSQHTTNWRLSQTDRKWIDRVGTYLTTFRTVPFTEYVHQTDMANIPKNQQKK